MVFNRFLIVLFFSYFTFAQKDEIVEIMNAPKVPKKKILREVSFMKAEQVPVFPGCEKENSRQAKSRCFQQKINTHIGKHFNADLANGLGLAPGIERILVLFKIDLKGNITNITARAPHPKLEEEAIRVIKKLPKMQPAKTRRYSSGGSESYFKNEKWKAVITKYAIPIEFVVDEKPIKEGIKK